MKKNKEKNRIKDKKVQKRFACLSVIFIFVSSTVSFHLSENIFLKNIILNRTSVYLHFARRHIEIIKNESFLLIKVWQ
jgi:hypothetical protein